MHADDQQAKWKRVLKRQGYAVLVISALLIGTTAMAVPGTPALALGTPANLSATAGQELSAARRATARFHDLAQAEAEGYINIDFYEPGEGFHWLKPSIIDGTFDPAQPEALLYAPVPGENLLRLVAVEYLVPISLSPGGPPDGFPGVADEWREDSEGAGLWELTVWLWMHNSNGMFVQHNPAVP